MVVSFFRMVPGTVPPMRGDASALGTLPLPAFQFCEAVRTASSMGWYIFPPKDMTLSFDGREIHVLTEAGSYPLASETIGPDFTALWNSLCPDTLQDEEPSWISTLSYPGIVQIWSGYCISTQPGWSVWIKPITNLFTSSSLTAFEGVVETDKFKPSPLFANFRIEKTDTPVHIQSTQPLFQVIALPEAAFFPPPDSDEQAVFEDEASSREFDWDGYLRTTRPQERERPHGKYGADIRKGRKQKDA